MDRKALEAQPLVEAEGSIPDHQFSLSPGSEASTYLPFLSFKTRQQGHVIQPLLRIEGPELLT